MSAETLETLLQAATILILIFGVGFVWVAFLMKVEDDDV